MKETDSVKGPKQDSVRDVDSVENGDNTSVVGVQKYAFDESRKIGITGATFLILNKMIGTGSKSSHFPQTQSESRT